MDNATQKFDVTKYLGIKDKKTPKGESVLKINKTEVIGEAEIVIKSFDPDSGGKLPDYKIKLPLSELAELRRQCTNNIKLFINADKSCEQLEADIKKIILKEGD